MEFSGMDAVGKVSPSSPSRDSQAVQQAQRPKEQDRPAPEESNKREVEKTEAKPDKENSLNVEA